MIGRTPIVRLSRINPNQETELLAKLEFFNPGGSVKDRIGLNMIKKAEAEGKLRPGGTIVEATSGNTGIGLAMVAAVKGYRLLLVMPETMSIERRKLLKAYGAEIILTPGEKGMRGAVEKAEELIRENKDYFMPRQFDNLANPEIHYLTTGPEIWEDTEGRLDYLVAGVGTGGTLTGSGRFLKEKNPHIKIIAVEPASSAVLSGEKPGRHGIQGIGAGFIPSVLEKDIIDEIIKVDDEDAFNTSRRLAREEGVLCGISAGAAVYAALKIAKKAPRGARILAIIPDTGERYLSTELFG
ncbi:cysteine synthase [Thermosyntropha lipolytica DSM 11003]|uniref:Cysteine synthase n=1 Tax=Thermosyntropha lipolytica DSM 11003 TaxID=1123382 RepID=A0A1M5NGI5_9FIRM|nr:cysteine synthase [Thermosyntropha lipolytica DSM 11003]